MSTKNRPGGGLTVAVSRCPACGGRLMYRTRITIDPYGFSSAWVCPVCEQKKCRLETGRQVHARFDYGTKRY